MQYAHASVDYVAYGYQEIRFVANWLYEMKVNGKEKELREEVKVLWSKRDTYLTDEIIKGLYN